MTILSLPPQVSNAPQWILFFTISDISIPFNSAEMKWFGANESHDLARIGSLLKIKYTINCTIVSFLEYCRDSNGIEISFKQRNNVVGKAILKDYQVFKSPPIHKFIAEIKKGAVVGRCKILMRISSISSQIPIVIRNPKITENTDLETPKFKEDRHEEKIDDRNDLQSFMTDREPPVPVQLDSSRLSRDPFLSPTPSASSKDSNSVISSSPSAPELELVKPREINKESIQLLYELERRALALKVEIDKTIASSQNNLDSQKSTSISDITSDFEEFSDAAKEEQTNIPAVIESADKSEPSTEFINIPNNIPEDLLRKINNLDKCELKISFFELAPKYKETSQLWFSYKTPFSNYMDATQFRSNLKNFIEHKQSFVTGEIQFQGKFEFSVIGNIPKTSRNRMKNDLTWKADAQLSISHILLSNNFEWKGELIFKDNKKEIGPDSVAGYMNLDLKFISGPENIQEEPNIVSTPIYYALDVQELTGIQNTEKRLVFLQLRPFNAGSKLTTSPCIWNPEFNIETGKLNEPFSFNFKQILPLPMSRQFLSQFGDKPVIVEVHLVTSDPNIDNDLSKSLLGIVKLPFNSLLDTFIASSKESLIRLPKTKYPIENPFSGKISGCLNVSMAVGPWEEIKDFLEENEMDENFLVPESESDDVEEVAQSVKSNSESLKKPSSPINEPKVEECVIQVIIHRACGLLGLLEKVIDIDVNNDAFEPLDFALQAGANSFVTIDLFPSEGSPENVGEDTIQSQVVPYSFVPKFDFNIELTVESLDSDLRGWMKNDGCAVGKLWHVIPRQFVIDGRDKICLGSFEIPLRDLLVQPRGIQEEWFTIGSSSQGAIQCSMFFKSGFGITSFATDIVNQIQQDVEISIQIENSIFQLREDLSSFDGLVVAWRPVADSNSDWIQSESFPVTISGDRCYCKEIYTSRKIFNFGEIVSHGKIEIEFYLVGESEFYVGSAFIKTGKLLSSARTFRRTGDSKIGKPTFESRIQVINHESPDIGYCHSDISLEVKILPKSKTNSTQLKRVLRTSIQRKLDLESNPEIALMKNSHEIESSRSQIEDSILKIDELQVNTDISENENGEILFSELENLEIPESRPDLGQTIEFRITIEKASNLPLADDPLAHSLSSPFVKFDDIKTTPPNACVSFTVPTGFKEEKDLFWTEIASLTTSPWWGYHAGLHLIKNVEVLQSLMTVGHVEFNVWDIQETSADFMSHTKSTTTKELIGTVTVGFAPLFSGLREIYGWYPIRTSRNICQGQLMVKISPSEDLSELLKEICDSSGINHSFSSNMSKSGNSCKLQLKSRSSGNNIPKKADQPEDTWVWDGKDWIHQQIQPVKDSLLEQDVPPVNLSKMIPTSNIEHTINELDKLKSDMISKFHKLQLLGDDVPLQADSAAEESAMDEDVLHDVQSISNLIAERGIEKSCESNPFLDSNSESFHKEVIEADELSGYLELGNVVNNYENEDGFDFAQEEQLSRATSPLDGDDKEFTFEKPPLPPTKIPLKAPLTSSNQKETGNKSLSKLEARFKGISDETTSHISNVFNSTI